MARHYFTWQLSMNIQKLLKLWSMLVLILKLQITMVRPLSTLHA